MNNSTGSTNSESRFPLQVERTLFKQPAMSRHARRRGLLIGTALVGIAAATSAGAQQWTGQTSSNYLDGANWSGGAVPTSGADIAFGAGAETTTVNLDTPNPGGYVTVGTVSFNNSASAYTVNVSNGAYLNINGGVNNTSGVTQNFTVSGAWDAGSFINIRNADAGSNVVYTVNAYGGVAFYSTDASPASGANARFVLDGGNISLSGSGTLKLGSVEGSGALTFYGSSPSSTGTFEIGALNTDTTLNGQIYEAGDGTLSLTKVGSGTLTLTGASTYKGGTTLSEGTLLIGNDAALGTGGLSMASGTTFGASGAHTFAQAITLAAGSETIDTSNGDLTLSSGISESGGAATLTKVGSGTLTLNGASSYTGGTILSGGTLSLGNNDALGTGALTAYAGTTIDIQNGISIDNALQVDVGDTIHVGTGTATYTGQITNLSDTAPIFKTGAGTLVLTNNDNDIGGALINEGTIQLTAGHALGSGPITLNGGTLQAGADLTLANVSFLFGPTGGTIDTQDFDVSTSASMGDNDTPTGTFTKTGTGTLTITGYADNNTYATATDVAEGTLKAGDENIFSKNSAYTVASGATLSLGNFDQAIGSLAGAGSVDAGKATLTTGNDNSSTVFSGTITGTGGLIKVGTGTFELSGNSSGFSGATEVQAGKMLVSGKLGSSVVTVDSGAKLGGTGTIGGLVAEGTVEPGKNAIGTLTVTGDASFASGSSYAVELTSTGTSDLIDVTGSTTITNGAALAITKLDAATYVPGTRYTVLQTSGFVGQDTFTLSNAQLSYFLKAAVDQDATHVYIDVDKSKTFGSAGLTSNQIATGAGLDSADNSALVSAVLALPNASAAQAAFDQLSGDIHASAKGTLVQDSHFLQDAVTARLRGAFGGDNVASLPVMAYGEDGLQPVAADTDRFAVWTQGFGAWGGTDGDGNAAAFHRSTGGLLVGADGRAGDWRIGLVGGYSRTSFDADDRNSSGDSDNYHLGLYGGTEWGAIAFRAGAAYTWNRISTSRSVAFDGFSDNLSANYDAATAQAFGELAYKTGAGPFAFEPFANLAYVNLHTDGFTETGGSAALTSGSSTTDATFTTLGVRASTDVTVGGVTATARGMFGWRHAFGDVTPLSTVAFAGGDAFTIAGVPIAKDAMLVEAGFDVQLARNTTLGVSYAGQFGPNAFDNGFKANLGVKF
ncbi:autotransporter domain-containing protein [Mesorhizobium shangrilense]|uniref:Autotransporter domain-containing protein n=1 Tax=Mesorhizobium shangrilense TaxID=460060 RepID=A0ABV2D7R5_9HYPH